MDKYKLLLLYSQHMIPARVASDRVPPLVLVDVHTLDICLCANVICAAGQSLEEAPSIAPSVDPGSVVIANPPYDAYAVTLYYTQVTSNLTPEPAERQEKSFGKE